MAGANMLVEFRVSNFRSFKEEQTLSLVAGRDRARKQSLINTGKFNLLKAAAIYGANASGKSNLFKAFELMCGFIRNSASKMNQGDKITGAIPFRLSSGSESKPSRFVVVLLVAERLYEYGFAATEARVWEEWLSVASPAGTHKKTWFSRIYNEASNDYSWKFDGLSQADGQVLRERTRDNGLALSRGAEQNVKPLSELFLAFDKGTWFFSQSMIQGPLTHMTAEHMRKNEDLARRIVTLMKDADLGIQDVMVEDGPPPPPGAIELLRKVVSKDVVDKVESGEIKSVSIKTCHRLGDTGQMVRFDMQEDESNGTQRFFALAGPLLEAMDQGTLIVVDEIDCSMHPLLTWKLVEYFQDSKINTKGAQIVFTTHDANLMSPYLLRRDQIWIVEKNREGATELCSLYDFNKKERPRGGESYMRNYLAGRYGGVPDFGPTFEDLESS
jgi:hypothetical protein